MKPPDRPSTYLRVRDVMHDLGCSKPWVFARLRAGDFEAVKASGVLLIVRSYLAAEY